MFEVSDLTRSFTVRRGAGREKATVHAVRGVSFELGRAETLALVGESGCGKSTTGLAALRLIEPTSGQVRLDDIDVVGLPDSKLRALRGRMQMVLQDPRGQLNPRMRISQTVLEPLRALGIGDRSERRQRAAEVLDLVGLGSSFVDRYPHQLSGGQRQRVGIARALAPNPDLIVLDEVVSALDVSVQMQVLNLLRDLQERLGLSYLFISHDMAVVSYLADRILVMYLGSVVESAPLGEFVDSPAHPYSQALLSSVPTAVGERARERIVLSGDVPSPLAPPPGCPFQPRCPRRQDICAEVVPTPVQIGPNRSVACHFPLD